MIYFLFESTLGFSLFKINEWDRVSNVDKKLLNDFDNFGTFKRIASLEANLFFKGHNVASELLAKISSGQLPTELSDFLKTSLPSVKKAKYQLAVQDKNLATKINEVMKIQCAFGEGYNDIFRSIRKHLCEFLKSESGELMRRRFLQSTDISQPWYWTLVCQKQYPV